MGISGIIAEFNPLHNGHKYLIDKAKNDGNTVICVISGNFVQRGDTAIIPKFTRAEMALLSGADIVAELPTPWAMSTAQNFAFGAVSQLLSLGIDTLYFGSESADTDKLFKVANVLNSNEYNNRISLAKNKNATFASIRNEIVSDILGFESEILNSPNDTLAVEYICAAQKLGANIKFIPVKRVGAGHNDTNSYGGFTNATLLRQAILNGDFEYIKHYMPENCVNLLLNSPISDINKLDTAIISRLKLLNKEDLISIPDLSEGIENLLYNKIRTVNNMQSLLSELKSKRYTLARIRRLVLSAFLGIDKKYFLAEPPYVRILGFKENAMSLINTNSKPIITKVSHIKQLDLKSQELFELENKVNEIYALSLHKSEKFTNEYKQKIIKK